MPRVGFEPKMPMFDRAKTVHILDRAGHCDKQSKYCLLQIHVSLFQYAQYKANMKHADNHR
jgi:hypothetical protein